ncbi:hypothetical protein [Rhizobium sp. CF142]|nr:hypothetical protein [Rhizobium sp. CF142]
MSDVTFAVSSAAAAKVPERQRLADTSNADRAEFIVVTLFVAV